MVSDFKELKDYVNGLFDKEEKRLEEGLRIYTILTHVTPEQEKEGFELVEKVKKLRSQRELFNEIVHG